jgi:acyl transferase domain-containing protein
MTTRDDSELLREGVAIIGMTGRFPGAQNLTQFWRNLREGVESVSFFSDSELRLAGVDPAIRSDPDYVGAGGALAGIDLFDAGFFGFNPREAEAMDPQQRLFLEVCWEALEHSGYDPGKYSGSIGVYAGTGFSTYFFNLYENKELLSLLGGHQVMIGNDKDHLTTHVSYKFNLRGPSVTIQTACSTSLVAVCMACRSLLDYQCDMALAGGSSIAIP